ncbi:MAG: hypothetical protein ACI9BF_000399 [Candidatus Paceibacteria bacterium]|jgi:hypothetical protein
MLWRTTQSAEGKYTTFEGTSHVEEFVFESINESVKFYAEVPVRNIWNENNMEAEHLVTIVIDSSQVATDERRGGHTSKDLYTEWTEGFDKTSRYISEGVNIVLQGGVYLDQLLVIGDTYAKVSKNTSEYTRDGIEQSDEFTLPDPIYQNEKG